MNFDWVATIIPIINAAGIPLLSIGIILLLRAYQKSIDAYNDTTVHLMAENKRIREQLSTLDTSYIESLNKMQDTVSKSMQAIGELQAAKVSLLSNPGSASAEAVKSDVEKIDKVLDKLSELVDNSHRYEYLHHEVSAQINHEFNALSKLITQIGDTKSRLAIIRVVSTDEVYKSVSSQVGETVRGLNFLPEKRPLQLEDLPESEIERLLLELRESETTTKQNNNPELPNTTSQKEKIN